VAWQLNVIIASLDTVTARGKAEVVETKEERKAGLRSSVAESR